MKKITTVSNGKEVVQYRFTPEDKSALSRVDIPVNPCLKCNMRGTCCGCPEAREYSSIMNHMFHGDKDLIKVAEQVVHARLEGAKILRAQRTLDAFISSLPNQVQGYAKDQNAIKIISVGSAKM